MRQFELHQGFSIICFLKLKGDDSSRGTFCSDNQHNKGRSTLLSPCWRCSPVRNHSKVSHVCVFTATVPKYTHPWQQKKHFCRGLYSLASFISTPPATICSFQSLAFWLFQSLEAAPFHVSLSAHFSTSLSVLQLRLTQHTLRFNIVISDHPMRIHSSV